MRSLQTTIAGQFSRSAAFALTLLLFTNSGLLSSVSAEIPPPDKLELEAQAISETSMSPFCPGRTISSCPSPQARELRGQIHTWLQQGYSPEAVKNQLLLIYGEDVRGTPQTEGFGIVGWTMPAVFVILSLALVFIKLRKMKPSDEHYSDAVVDAESERRVEDALRRRAM